MPPNEEGDVPYEEMYYPARSGIKIKYSTGGFTCDTYVLVSCVTNDPNETPTITFHVPLHNSHPTLLLVWGNSETETCSAPTLSSCPTAASLFEQYPCEIWASHSFPVSSVHSRRYQLQFAGPPTGKKRCSVTYRSHSVLMSYAYLRHFSVINLWLVSRTLCRHYYSTVLYNAAKSVAYNAVKSVWPVKPVKAMCLHI
jgi:hypothetical protein